MEAPKQKAENQLSEKDLEAVKESIRIEQEETKTRKREASDKELLEDGANYKVNEHGTRLDPTDKQFEEIRNSDERTRTKESSEAKENEPTEKAPEVFQNNQNRKDFEELNGAAKEVISNVYNNVKVGFIDRYKVVRDNKLYSLHKERVVELKEKVNAKKQDIEQIKANSKTHEIRVNGLRKQFGELSPKAEKEVTKEKKKLENALKDADLEETRLIAEQVFNEKKEKEYGEKRTEIINRIETFVDDKIEPYEAQADDLKEWVNELDQEINNFKGERDVFAKDLKEFRRKIFVLEGSDGGILASEKVMYDGKIKEIEKEIKEFDSSINLVEKEKGKTNSKINKLGVKIDYWKEVSRKAKEDGMPKPQEQPADTSEKESISSETEVKSEEKIENPEDNKEWFDAVMPSKESEDKYNKTKEWYEASGLSKKDMENVTNAEIKETTPEEKAGVEVNENSENNDESDEEKENENESKEGLKDIESQMNKYKDQWNKLFGKKLPLNETNFSRRNVITTVALLRTNFLGQRIELGRLIEDAVIRENDRQPISTRIEMAELAGMFEKMRKEKNLFHTYIHSGNVNKEAA